MGNPTLERQIEDRRATLIRECDKLIHAAEAAGRDMTDSEKAAFDSKELECRALDEKLARVQKLDRYNVPGERKTRASDPDSDPHSIEPRHKRTAAKGGEGQVSFRDIQSGAEVRGYSGTTPMVGPELVRQHPAIEPFLEPGGLGSWMQYSWDNSKSAERVLSKDMRRALRELRDQSTASNFLGGYLTPEVLISSLFIDRMRARMVLTRAGAVTLALESDSNVVARQSAAPLFSVHTENVEESLTDVTFDAISLVPRTLMAVVRISDELLQDAINGGSVIERVLVDELAVEVDRLALVGSNPNGLTTLAANSVTQAPATMDWDDVLDAVDALRQDNVEPNAIVCSPSGHRRIGRIF